MNATGNTISMRRKIPGLIAAGVMAFCATAAQAATDSYWIGGSGGSEAAPLELYSAANWTTNRAEGLPLPVNPSKDYNLHLQVESQTYITNSASASTQIATALRFLGGDFVVSGSLKFNSFGYLASETAPVSIDKRGDWACPREFFLATTNNASVVFTNRTGKLAICSEKPARLGAGDDSTATFVIEDGAVTGSSSNYHCSLAYGAGSMGYIEQNGGTLSMAGRLQIGFGSNSTGRYVQNGGTASVSSDLYVGYNGAGELTINDGTFTAKSKIVFGTNGGSSSGNIVLNGGTLVAKRIECSSSQGSTILFDGGTLKAYADGVLIAAHDGLSVTAGPGGGTVDAAGKSVTIEEPISGAGGMSFVGGGSVAITNGNTYAGATTVEIGTVLHIPGPADFPASFVVAVPAAAPQDGVYTVAVIDGAGVFSSVPDGIVKPANVTLRLSADSKSILCIYGNPPNTWIGGASGSLSEDRNWSLGYVPTSGDSCFIGSGAEADLTVGSVFAPDVITFTSDSASVTISGENAISGITVITNLSAVNHTINVPVRFMDKIRVKQAAIDFGARAESHVVFAGGAYGTTFDGDYSRFISGHYILSDDTGAWSANESSNGKVYGLLYGSSVTVPYVTDMSQLRNGVTDGTTTANGGAFTTGVYRAACDVSRHNFSENAEFVVTNELAMTLSGNRYLSYRIAAGWFKFEKVTIDKSSTSHKFYFSHSGSFSGSAKYIRVGAGGIGFEDGQANSPSYQFGNKSADKVTIAAWHDDFSIGTKGQPGNADVTFAGNSTSFDTTDESGVGRTITLDAICAGSSAVNIKGLGAVVVNNPANTCSGAVGVSDSATLALNAGCPLGTGAVTVNGGATLEVAESGTVALAGDLTLKNYARLGFNFTSRDMPILDLADRTVKFEESAATNVVVSISGDEGERSRGGELTNGGNFSGVNVSLAADKPDWVKGISVNGDGNIVLEVKPRGLLISVK